MKLIKSYYTKRIESAILSSLFFERHSDRADKIKGVDSLSTVTNAIERDKKRFFFLESKESFLFLLLCSFRLLCLLDNPDELRHYPGLVPVSHCLSNTISIL